MFKLYPYKIGSASVKKLKRELDALIIKPENSKYRNKSSDTVINWGNSTRIPNLEGVEVINPPENVAIATNKLKTLEELEEAGVSHVPFTTSKTEAEEWGKVFVRHSLTGHSGEGIEVVESTLSEPEEDSFIQGISDLLEELLDEAPQDKHAILIENLMAVIDEEPRPELNQSITLPDAPLYTQAVNNNGEYRVHVFDGEVILYQKKSRRVDEETGEVITAEGEAADVRNLASNWIYRTGNLNKLDRVEDLAVEAIQALGLDFGAVDIIMNNDGDVFVLEINTAPGLGNTDTLEAYVEAISNII